MHELKFSHAQEIADTIEELLDVSRRWTQTRNRGYCALVPPPGFSGDVRPERPKPPSWRVVADLRTNSVIVIAPCEAADDVERITELIRRLDVSVFLAREVQKR